MNQKLALQIIFGVSILGILFSGTLTYQEIFGLNAASCPSPGAPGTILGYPACVYGFFMYIVLGIVSFLGLLGSRPRNSK